jgi:hypothetical protein
VPTRSVAAPIEAPVEIGFEAADPGFDDEGIPDLVEGGVPGGILGGVAVTLGPEIPPPPPPPLPPAPRSLVRVGGEIKEPALLHRVEPVYPPVAVATGLEGTVILEAVVDRDGIVESLRVLRSQGLLDKPALGRCGSGDTRRFF